MGFLSDLGAPSIGGLDGGTTQTILVILSIFAVLIIVGGFTFAYYLKKNKKKQYKYKIIVFRDTHGKPTPITQDLAKEVFIPNSNVSLIYLKNSKLYLPRPTLSMGTNQFWYNILPNGEWVNYDISMDKGGKTFAEANLDHRDTRYSYINLKEIIKRNYGNKSVKWWKEYAPLITFIVISFVFILGCWILLARIGKLITQLGPIAENMASAAEIMAKGLQTSQNLNSGIVGA